jgi:hypothetical protein
MRELVVSEEDMYPVANRPKTAAAGGRQVALRTNFFPLDVSKLGGTGYHYDVCTAQTRFKHGPCCCR